MKPAATAAGGFNLYERKIMKLYKVSAKYSIKLNGAPVLQTPSKYLGTKGECIAYRKELMEAGAKRKEIETEAVDIPTNKEGLVEWLNQR
jgi:hypothetical protein